MAHLKKSDLREGTLSYRRRKNRTAALHQVGKMYAGDRGRPSDGAPEPHLLPILTLRATTPHGIQDDPAADQPPPEKIARMAGFSPPSRFYCARHSWASAAKNKNIPVSIISEGHETRFGGHDANLPRVAGQRAGRQCKFTDSERPVIDEPARSATGQQPFVRRTENPCFHLPQHPPFRNLLALQFGTAPKENPFSFGGPPAFMYLCPAKSEFS